MRLRWRRIPRIGRWLAVAAVLNSLAWALIVPVGEVPDEDQQIAYAQYVAETGKLPVEGPGRSFGPNLDATLGNLFVYQQVGRPYIPPIWTVTQEAGLRDLELHPQSPIGGDAEAATYNPPLYYLTTAVAYHMGDTLLDRIYLMRFVSVLLAGLTALLAFMFVREVLPRHPWAWAAGGAAVAFQPEFAFISGGVHNDNMVICFATAELFLVARTFRRGLSLGRAIGLGLVLAAGMLAKAPMIAFVPVVIWTLLVAGIRLRDLRLGARLAGAAAAAFAVPMGIYLALGHWVWHRGLYSGASGFVSAPGVNNQTFSLLKDIEFTWQLALPRLPFMTDLIPGVPIRDTFLYGLVGRFGWEDYSFSTHVDRAAQYVVEILAVLAVIAVVRNWRVLRTRWPELVAYLGAVVGVFAVIGVAAYRARLNGFGSFEQGRYLLPLIGLYGLAVATATTALGRWGRVLAGVMIVVVLGHNLFAQLLTLQRYYT